MSMYNLKEYSENYSKTYGSLCQYYGDDPNATIKGSESSKSKSKIKGSTPADGIFIFLGFLLPTFTIHWTAGKEGDHFLY